MTQIDGIRLSRGMVLAACSSDLTHLPRYLADHRINMVCAGGHYDPLGSCFSCCLDSDHFFLSSQIPLISPVSKVCIYPHGRDTAPLGLLASILFGENIHFHHMVSSHALISVILNQRDEDRFIACLESCFELPPSAPPYVQNLDMDISQVLNGYPEVRASYEEAKIKTYGIQLMKDLSLSRGPLDGGGSGIPDRFSFVSVLPGKDKGMDCLLVGPGKGEMGVEHIHFYGPHFGDRYRILQTALDCLAACQINPLVMGCTGASVSLVFAKGQGEAAQRALERGFESP